MWKAVEIAKTLVDVKGKYCRTISPNISVDRMALPEPSMEEIDQWSERISHDGPFSVGEISHLGMNTKLDTEFYRSLMTSWLETKGIASNPTTARIHPFACVGAGFHHDADDYPDEMFSVLWLSDNTPWDLLFPYAGMRIPLEMGTIVLFDTAQPHAVVKRGASTFTEESLEFVTGTFLSQHITINKQVMSAMGIEKYSCKGKRGFQVLNREGYREDLDYETGSWHLRELD